MNIQITATTPEDFQKIHSIINGFPDWLKIRIVSASNSSIMGMSFTLNTDGAGTLTLPTGITQICIMEEYYICYHPNWSFKAPKSDTTAFRFWALSVE